MLLKALLLSLTLFAGGTGILRASVILENYLLLAGGVLLSLGAILLVSDASAKQRATRSVS